MMKVALVLGVVLFAIFAGGVDSKAWDARPPPYALSNYQDQDPAIPNNNVVPDFQKFQRFVAQHSRVYNNLDEYQIRYGIFRINLREVDRRNSEHTGTKYAINDLSDRTQKELHGRNGFKEHNNNDDSSSSNDNYKKRSNIY